MDGNNKNNLLCIFDRYPPETLRKFCFTTMSDVWSFGCVVWEIFDCCNKTKDPLGLSLVKNDQVKHVEMLEEGKRKEKPEHCPLEIYEEVIRKCWNGKDVMRPKFNEIVRIWDALLPQLSW